jgi:carbonic anhydrase
MKKFLLALLTVVCVTTCQKDQARGPKVLLAPCNPNEEVINISNSALYAEVVLANDVFEMSYIARPDMFAKKKAVVLTCMDPRLNDLDAIMGLETGDVYVIRNAGGRASEDALRSLILSYKLLGAEQIFVIQHTDCAMQKFTNAVMNDLLTGSLVTATLIKNCNITLNPLQSNNVCQWVNTSSCCGASLCNGCGCIINWLTINNGLPKSVLEDVKTIRNHPLIPSDIPIYGFIFDVMTGDLIPVPKANLVGRATPLYCK